MINKFKSVLDYFKKAFTFFDNSKIEEYQVEHTLDALHGIKREEIKEESPEVEAEKTLIEAKSKLRERRKAPKKIKVPKDPA